MHKNKNFKRIFSLIVMMFIAIFVLCFSGNVKASAKVYDNTPDVCTHNLVKIAGVTKSTSALSQYVYKNDNVVEGSTGVRINFPKASNRRITEGNAEVTVTVELEEPRLVDIYWEFGFQSGYNTARVTITHDGTVTQNVQLTNANWNIDHVECHAGTNTLKYKVTVGSTSWQEINEGRNFHVVPSYIPTFDENDMCTQCGITCSHSTSKMEYDDNKHYYQCHDLCHKHFAVTESEHEFDSDDECVYCRYTRMEQDENGVYQINNIRQLSVFTKYINKDAKTSIKGKLNADLDFKGIDYEPIGTSARVFVGEFDGGNHRIYNLNMSDNNYSQAGMGFFGFAGSTIESEAKISNLTIDKSCSFASNKATGGIVGYVGGEIFIDHCGNEANITSLTPDVKGSLSGGIIGCGGDAGVAHISYCYNTGTIIGGSTYWGQSEDNCWYYGSGGISGYLGSATYVDHSFNTGIVTTTLCENDGAFNYVRESIFNTSFVNTFGQNGTTIGEDCYNYEPITYRENNTVSQYTSLTDGSLLAALNSDAQTGLEFIQGANNPVFSIGRELCDPSTCTHHFVATKYEWAEDLSSCKGVAVCVNCAESLVEEKEAICKTTRVIGQSGLLRLTYVAAFINKDVFMSQKQAVDYKMSVIHTVTLNANGGNGTPCTFYYEGEEKALPLDYIKDGLYIEGWYENSDFSGEKVLSIPATETEDKVFYAKYEEHTCTLEHHDAVPATCIVDGMQAYDQCTVCGAIREGGLPIRATGHNFALEASGASIVASCSNSGCNESYTITLVRDGYYGAIISGQDKWIEEGFLVPEIYYEGVGQTEFTKKTAMPVMPGTYKASMKIDDTVAELEYTVTHVEYYLKNANTIAVDADGNTTYTLVLLAPENVDFDGNPKFATFEEGYDIFLFRNPVIKYYKGTEEIASCIAAGTYKAKVTIGGVTAELEFEIPKADPNPTIPEGLETVYGNTLNDVTLPSGWTWKDSSLSVGNVGNNKFIGVFTPEDLETYNVVEKEITVKVEKANPEYTVPNLEAEDGISLNQVALPAGFSWMNGDALVEGPGQHVFKAIFTPEDTDNYNIIENIDITVLVKWNLIDDDTEDEEVVVTINNSDEEYDPNVTIEIEVKTTVMAQESESEADFEAIKEKLEANEKITKVYDVKLIRTVDGVSTEIQPSDIKPGTVITIEMTLPDDIAGKEFRILHIHSNNDIEFITNFTKNGNVVSFETDRLSEFAFIGKVDTPDPTPTPEPEPTPDPVDPGKDNEKKRHGFCVGVVLMILSILLYLFVALFAILRFGFFKELVAKVKLDVLYNKVTLFEFIALYASGTMFLFSLISLVLHQCGFTIVFFILNFLVCAGAVFLFLVDQQLIKLSFKKKAKEE